MRRMNYCPVCASPLQTGSLCSCGYDISQDYETGLSLQKITSKPKSVRALREAHTTREQQKLQKMLEELVDARIAPLAEANQELTLRVEALKKELQEIKQQASQLPVPDKGTHAVKFYGFRNKKPLKTQNILTFGSYPQGPNGEVKAIEWIILDARDNRRLLISRAGLDCRQYHNRVHGGITWQSSSLRQWLNRDFFMAAFSAREQQLIDSAVVSADKNDEYGTDPGNDTYDKVFLLSISEVEQYFSEKDRRKVYPTEYAKMQGGYVYSNGCCSWWLRSPGSSSLSVAKVDYNGENNRKGISAHYENNVVRPAIWLLDDA